MNPLVKLGEHGQSPWLDYIDRPLLDSGKLSRMVAEDGVKGVTSNPSILCNAIGKTTDYDDALAAFVADDPSQSDKGLYERLAIQEIRRACDQMLPVYEQGRDDGFVSLEVSPTLAADTQGTIDEAIRLWEAIGCPNLMIKVPATPEGIPAIRALIGLGINVNVTLIFSLSHYDQVARAYIAGLQDLATSNPARLSEVDSVASVFVSRIDSKIDDLLNRDGSDDALALRGKVAVANSKMVYQRFLSLFESPEFAELRAKGARHQRPLWASTSTKNPEYNDVLYVEELIGEHTVNTLPPNTLEAFRDHGRVADRVTEGLPEASDHLAALAALGFDLHDLCETLQHEGVVSFAKAFDELMAAVASKRAALV